MKNYGILFIATGERYLLGANIAATSIREIMGKSIQIDIFCDETKWLDKKLYDHIEVVENPHRRSKVDYLCKTRFDRTLFLDTDIKIVENISHMFELLDKYDVAMAHAHSRNRARTLKTWRKELPKAFPQYNSGVLLYNSQKPEVIRFMEDWRDFYHEAGFGKDQTTLRELLWDTNLKLHTLPPEYNIRYEKYLDFWEEQEAKPHILHFPRFKDDIVTSNPDNDAYKHKPKTTLTKLKDIFWRKSR